MDEVAALRWAVDNANAALAECRAECNRLRLAVHESVEIIYGAPLPRLVDSGIEYVARDALAVAIRAHASKVDS